jgi:hypothetical protein
VFCAGSTLLLVQSKALDEAPYKLSGAVAKLAYITFWSLAFSYWIDKPWFLTEGKTCYCAHHTFLVPNWAVILPASSYFSGAVVGEKEYFCKESFAHTSFTLFIVLLYFIFACIVFIKNTKKLVSY